MIKKERQRIKLPYLFLSFPKYTLNKALIPKRTYFEGIYPNHPWDEPVIQVSEELETRKCD